MAAGARGGGTEGAAASLLAPPSSYSPRVSSATLFISRSIPPYAAATRFVHTASPTASILRIASDVTAENTTAVADARPRGSVA